MKKRTTTIAILCGIVVSAIGVGVVQARTYVQDGLVFVVGHHQKTSHRQTERATTSARHDILAKHVHTADEEENAFFYHVVPAGWREKTVREPIESAPEKDEQSSSETHDNDDDDVAEEDASSIISPDLAQEQEMRSAEDGVQEEEMQDSHVEKSVKQADVVEKEVNTTQKEHVVDEETDETSQANTETEQQKEQTEQHEEQETLNPDTTVHTITIVILDEGDANVYVRPTTESATVGTVMAGEEFITNTQQHDWYYITLPDGEEGWVHDVDVVTR